MVTRINKKNKITDLKPLFLVSTEIHSLYIALFNIKFNIDS
jgi:hypothetical protein